MPSEPDHNQRILCHHRRRRPRRPDVAIDLGRRGVRCLILERHPTTLPWPKMDRSNARTMEFYRRIGIVDRVRALGYPPDNPMDACSLPQS